jgi:HK97 family phage major capsid protein
MPKDMTVEELAEDIKKSHSEALDKVKEIAEDALGKAKAGETQTASAKEKADEALLKLGEMAESLEGLKQKMARSGGGGAEQRKSLGQQYVESENFKSFAEKRPNSGSAILEIKAPLTSLTTPVAGSVGDGIAPDRQSGIQEMPQRRMVVRDLLMPGETESNAVQYVQETGFNNAAAAVAEGGARPQSDIQLELITGSVKTIGHHFKASREVLADVAQLRSLIDGRLRGGVDLAEEVQLLHGDGTGNNLTGLTPSATAYAAPGGLTSANVLDVLRFAALQAVLAEFPASGYILNPIDWAHIETMKDGEGRYIIGQPQGSVNSTLWRLPVVQTQAQTVDTFLTGAFNMNAQLFDREETRVEVGYVDQDFTNGMVTIVGDERIHLANYRPEGFITGDLGRVA